MRACLYALIAAACILSTNWIFGQDLTSPAAATPRPPSSDQPSTSTTTVMRTNSMAVLDDKKKLGPNDYVSFMVEEDRDNDSQRLWANENGELEVLYFGTVPARGKSCKALAQPIKSLR